MIAAIRKPLAPSRVALGTAAVAAAVALYCLAYSALAGRPESAAGSFAWALVNVAPWLPALEAAKRARSLPRAFAALACGFAVSLGLGLVLGPADIDPSFEAWRRLPALLAVAAAAMALRWDRGRAVPANDPLPLLPGQIDWVRAAGNYVELRAQGRTVVHRSSIGAAERALAAHGFVRIHRSTLVRRDRIARVRPADVVLLDGTHLPVGKRFRAHLGA